MVNTASIMKKKKALIGILLCFLALCCICEVSGNISKNVLKTSKDIAPEVITSAELKQTAAQSMSGVKTTDVDTTPFHSGQLKSAVHKKKNSLKVPSVNNQKEAGGFENGRHSAPTIHEDSKPVKIRSNGWHRKHKVSMKKFLIRRALIKKNNDLELQSSSGISQEPAKSLAGKSGPFETKMDTIGPATAESAQTDSTKLDTSANLYTLESTTVESVKLNSAGTDSKLDLNPTGFTTFGESQDEPAEEYTAEETINEKTTGNNGEEPLPREQPTMPEEEQNSQHGGTSTIPEVAMNVHPELRATSGLRWNVALERRDTSDSEKDKRHKKKKKPKHQSSTKDPADDGSPIIVGGIIGGLFILMAIVTCVFQLWKKCRRRSARKRGDPETGHMTSSSTGKTSKKDKSNKMERTTAGKNKKKTSITPQSSLGHPNATSDNKTTDAPTATPNKETGTPVREVRIDMEDSDSTLPESLSTASVSSASSIGTPNVTPPSTPLESRSEECVTIVTQPSTGLESHSAECLANVTQPLTGLESRSAECLSRHVTQPFTLLASRSAECLTNVTQPSTVLGSRSAECVTIGTETGTSNSSNESCKTPVAPCSEVKITVEDDDECKSPLLTSENESSSAEVIYAWNESTTDTTMNTDIPLPPPPPNRPLSTSTGLRQGKSIIGGRKALENRRFIKHLTSGQHSSGFHGDLNKAVDKILTGNKLFANKSKEKRKVIKQQTKDNRTSLKENILKSKSIVMSEKMDSVRDKKCAVRRRIIHKGLSHPTDSTLRPHTPLSKEVAFAQSVILPSPINKNTERKTKERRKVAKKLIGEVNKPSFEDVIKVFAGTFNPGMKTRDLNYRGAYRRHMIKTDAKMPKAWNQKSSFLNDIEFARHVICGGQSAFGHDRIPRMGCLCYFCVKHWTKTGGPPCYRLPTNFNIAKDVYLINGKIYIRKPSPSRQGSSYRPGIDTARLLLNGP